MVRVAKKSDTQRLKELKRKIKDRKYMSKAINRLALKLTEEFVSRANHP